MKFASNMFDIIDTLYYLGKMLASFPYTKTVDDNKQRIYVKTPFRLKQLIHYTGVILILTTTVLIRTIDQISRHALTFVEAMDGALYIMAHGFAIIAVTEMVLTQKQFLMCLKLINSSDELLRNEGIFVSYKILHVMEMLMIYGVFPCFLFLAACPIWELVDVTITKGVFCREFADLILILINQFILSGVRFITIYLYGSFLLNAQQKLQSVNKLLTDVDSKASANHTFSITAELHNNVYELIQNLNEAFAWSTFLRLSLGFLALIVLPITGQQETEIKPYQNYVFSFYVMVPTFAVLIPCQWIKNEANKTGRILCELNVPFFDEELSERRTTLLLQLQHETIIITAGRFYTIDMTALTSHIGLIITLLMFFYNIYSYIKVL